MGMQVILESKLRKRSENEEVLKYRTRN